MVAFIIENNEGIRRVEVRKTDLIVGREGEVDLLLSGDDKISRRHVRILRGKESWIVEDLGSANGTLVNAERVKKKRIERGDVLTLGDTTLTFLGDEEATPKPGAAPERATEFPCDPGPAFLPGRFLGSGATHRVWAARRKKDGADVALRLPREIWKTCEGFEAWVADRTRLWARLEHPHLQPLERVALPAGGGMLVEPLMREGTLAQRLAVEGRQDILPALDIVRGTAQALGVLHALGWTHGGVRPSAIRLDLDGRPKLAGPGRHPGFLAVVGDGGAGALHDSAPEWFEPDGVVGKASDIWSLGALLHELLIGRPPAEGKTLEAVAARVRKGLYKPPREFRPDLPRAISDFIEACLARDPKERPACVEDFLERLGELQAKARERKSKGPIRMEGRERELGERQDVPKKSLRHRVMSWSLTVVIGVILNVGLYLYLTKDQVDSLSGSETASQFGPPPARSAEGRRQEILDLCSRDLYEKANERVRVWQSQRDVMPDEARSLRQQIQRSLEARVARLSQDISALVENGDRQRAHEGLALLERLVGRDAPASRRMRRLVEGR
ncbi:MAG TPA: FHA domain-containing protein [Planctomycetes bacterium]|nr:FHA domain-containing protein [Planctomycetota bacterium]